MKTFVAILLFVVASCLIAALVSGASFLGFSLIGGLPLGNVFAALALVAPASVAFLMSTSGSALRVVALTALFAALAWLPGSIVLAGNLALNFPGWRGTAWIGFSSIVGLAVLFSLACSVFHKLALIWRRARVATGNFAK